MSATRRFLLNADFYDCQTSRYYEKGQIIVWPSERPPRSCFEVADGGPPVVIPRPASEAAAAAYERLAVGTPPPVAPLLDLAQVHEVLSLLPEGERSAAFEAMFAEAKRRQAEAAGADGAQEPVAPVAAVVEAPKPAGSGMQAVRGSLSAATPKGPRSMDPGKGGRPGDAGKAPLPVPEPDVVDDGKRLSDADLFGKTDA